MEWNMDIEKYVIYEYIIYVYIIDMMYNRIINGLTPWCRRPPFQGGAAGKGQNGPHVQ
jgi:hypothetical protein